MTPFERGMIKIPWWFWIGLIDLFLVLMTTLKWYAVDFPGKNFLVLHFNLATERKAAVWFSGITLLVLAMIALDLYEETRDRSRNAWWLLSFVFAFLSLDEIGSLHERFGGWPDLFILGGVPALLALFGLGILYRDPSTRPTALFLFTGFLVLCSVAIQEHFEHLVAWPDWAVGIRAGVEEGTELLGFFILLWALIGYRKSSGNLGDLLPDPARWTKFQPILLSGLLLHSGASLILPTDTLLSQRGNPLTWYPQIVCFFLFAASFRESQRPHAESKSAWYFMAAFFLMCSVGMIYNPPRFLGIGRFVAKDYLETALFLCLAGGLSLFCAFKPHYRKQVSKSILVIISLIGVHFYMPSLGMKSLISGIIVFITQDIIFKYIPRSCSTNFKQESFKLTRRPDET